MVIMVLCVSSLYAACWLPQNLLVRRAETYIRHCTRIFAILDEFLGELRSVYNLASAHFVLLVVCK